MKMELHQIKSFVTVANTGNLTRAAEQLNTTPPSVSAHIRQLEAEFDLKLFIRTSKGMTLTEQGKDLVLKAKDILDCTAAFSTAAQQSGGQIKETLKLGINADPDFLKIHDIVHCLFTQHPGLTLEVAALNTGDILKQVSSGFIDLGYVFGSHIEPKLTFMHLSKVTLEVVVPIGLKNDFETAGWKEICQLPWIKPVSLCPFLRKVTKLLSEKGLTLTQTITANDDITRTAFINQGIAATVLEHSEAKQFEKEEKVFIWKKHEPIYTQLSLACKKSKLTNPYIHTLTGVMQNLWKPNAL